ncbi:hypothetical protein AXF42_Ash019429 [Apostasia shenzhenica]|uniref:Uncharacterized protein n=1 Tax=Apostasia shenzhenica TaxID=1088818 RepID=A0A2I0B4X2_9ASPA|nr:hypothetical protein AXF42_Ash019429 [Apostasia shenzhenica]
MRSKRHGQAPLDKCQVARLEGLHAWHVAWEGWKGFLGWSLMVNPLLQVAQKYQAAVKETGSAGVSVSGCIASAAEKFEPAVAEQPRFFKKICSVLTGTVGFICDFLLLFCQTVGYMADGLLIQEHLGMYNQIVEI